MKGQKTGGDVPFGYELKVNPMSGKKILSPIPQEQRKEEFEEEGK